MVSASSSRAVLAVTRPAPGGGSVTVTRGGLVTTRDSFGRTLNRRQISRGSARNFVETEGANIQREVAVKKVSEGVENLLSVSRSLEDGGKVIVNRDGLVTKFDKFGRQVEQFKTDKVEAIKFIKGETKAITDVFRQNKEIERERQLLLRQLQKSKGLQASTKKDGVLQGRISATPPPDLKSLAGIRKELNIQRDMIIQEIESSRFRDPQGTGVIGRVFKGTVVLGTIGAAKGVLGVATVIRHPIETAKGVGQAIRHPIQTVELIGQEFAVDPVGTVAEFLAFSKVVKILGKGVKTGLDKTGLPSLVKQKLFVSSQPKAAQGAIAKILAKTTKKNLSKIKKVDFVKVKGLTITEGKALLKALEKTDSVRIKLKPKGLARTPTPVGVDIATTSFNKLSKNFVNELPKSIRNEYLIQGNALIRKSTGSAVMNVKSLSNIVRKIKSTPSSLAKLKHIKPKTKIKIVLKPGPKKALIAIDKKIGLTSTFKKVHSTNVAVLRTVGTNLKKAGISIRYATIKTLKGIQTVSTAAIRQVSKISKSILKALSKSKGVISDQIALKLFKLRKIFKQFSVRLSYKTRGVNQALIKLKKGLKKVSTGIKKTKTRITRKAQLTKIGVSVKTQLAKIAIKKRIGAVKQRLKLSGEVLSKLNRKAIRAIESRLKKLNIEYVLKKQRLAINIKNLTAPALAKISRLLKIITSQLVKSKNLITKPILKALDSIRITLKVHNIKIRYRVYKLGQKLKVSIIKPVSKVFKSFREFRIQQFNTFVKFAKRQNFRVGIRFDKALGRLESLTGPQLAKLSLLFNQLQKVMARTKGALNAAANRIITKIKKLIPFEIKIIKPKITKLPKVLKGKGRFSFTDIQTGKLRVFTKKKFYLKALKMQAKFLETTKGKALLRKLQKAKTRPARLSEQKAKELDLRQKKIELKLSKGQSIKAERGLTTTIGGKKVYPFQDIKTGKIRFFTSRKTWLKALKQQIKLKKGGLIDLEEFFTTRERVDSVLNPKILKFKKGAKIVDAKGKSIIEFKFKKVPKDAGLKKGVGDVTEIRSGQQALLKRLKPRVRPKVKALQKTVIDLDKLFKEALKKRVSQSQALKFKQKLKVTTRKVLVLQKQVQTNLKAFKGLKAAKFLIDFAKVLANIKVSLDKMPGKLPIIVTKERLSGEIKTLQKARVKLKPLLKIPQEVTQRGRTTTRTRLTTRVIPKVKVIPKTIIKILPTVLPKLKIKHREEEKERELKKVVEEKIKKRKLIYIPDLFSSVFGIKANKKERRAFLKKDRVFSGTELRKLI